MRVCVVVVVVAEAAAPAAAAAATCPCPGDHGQQGQRPVTARERALQGRNARWAGYRSSGWQTHGIAASVSRLLCACPRVAVGHDKCRGWARSVAGAKSGEAPMGKIR